MNIVEILPEGDEATRDDALIIEWANTPGREIAKAVIDANPFFTQFGNVPAAGIDLARTAIGAYLADRFSPRSSVNWSRQMVLVVHMIDPAGFAPALDLLQPLLFWITGDDWQIVPVAGESKRPDPLIVEPAPAVSLLSGGLDSLCGGLLSDSGTVFVGQRDSKAVAHAQHLLRDDLVKVRGSVIYEQLRVQAPNARERSSRSRSTMFTSLGTALAAARGARILFVPENGFTSLNPPLASNRGGPHTTRSTHPTTIAYANAINAALGLDVRLENPYEQMTKGELVETAANAIGRKALEGIIPHTYSCATSNGHFFKGGSAFLNCGVCVACMTRRGSIREAKLVDQSEYLIDRLQGSAREAFLAERGGDLSVVRALAGWQPDEATLTAIGPFPPGYDFEVAKEVLARGMKELVNGLP
jgi:7-cyano-7-deazaguanine synthase in queuosine biosynthesis